jgi:glycosyltransferase involved in cell wall biosynthesis
MRAADRHDPQPLYLSIVTETYPPEVNGVARTVAALVEQLRRRGHHVQLVRPRQRPGERPALGPGFEEVLVAGLRLPRFEDIRLGLPAGRALRACWRARRPDVAHVVTEGPLGWSALAAARRLGLPVSSGFHTNFHSYSRHYGLRLLTSAVGRYLRALHNRADCTVVPTEETRARLAAAGFERLAVVGRGIDGTLFNPGRRSAALRRRWGCAAQETVVAYVGRLAPEKNLGLFVAAALELRRIEPGARIVLVGDGPDARALRARHPEFVFCGPRYGVDLAEHYASADVFLFPSLTETFGNVVTEALASGLAVVAFDYAAARQYVRHGVSGLLAPWGDQGEFLAQARALAADAGLAARLRRSAAAVAAGLTWDRAGAELEAVLRGVAGGRGPRAGRAETAAGAGGAGTGPAGRDGVG